MRERYFSKLNRRTAGLLLCGCLITAVVSLCILTSPTLAAWNEQRSVANFGITAGGSAITSVEVTTGTERVELENDRSFSAATENTYYITVTRESPPPDQVIYLLLRRGNETVGAIRLTDADAEKTVSISGIQGQITFTWTLTEVENLLTPCEKPVIPKAMMRLPAMIPESEPPETEGDGAGNFPAESISDQPSASETEGSEESGPSSEGSGASGTQTPPETGNAPPESGGGSSESGDAPPESGGGSSESGDAPSESDGAPSESGGGPSESGGGPSESDGGALESGGAPSESDGAPSDHGDSRAEDSEIPAEGKTAANTGSGQE